ncbi:MAG: dethiobiotin synthase [Gammaproteobacteria bacterium]
MPYEDLNPCALPEACSPHIAAKRHAFTVNASNLVSRIRDAVLTDVDWVLAEGAGGWFAPINDCETMADVAIGLGWPVIQVVGLRLGCLNHALLTHRAIESSGLPVAGWIACQVDAHLPHVAENCAWLESQLSTPLLGMVPWLTRTEPHLAQSQDKHMTALVERAADCLISSFA